MTVEVEREFGEVRARSRLNDSSSRRRLDRIDSIMDLG